MARLDRLAPVREVAQIGAAIGREFSYPLLSAVAHQPDDRLQEALGRLIRAELVFGRGEVPEAVYTFRHALVQEAAYASLLRERRRTLHAHIAQALEGEFPEVAETQPELVAHHYAAAGLAAPAIDYCRRAAERAMAASANAEAIAHLTKGLELINSLPESPERISREIDLRLALGTPLKTKLPSGNGKATPCPHRESKRISYEWPVPNCAAAASGSDYKYRKGGRRMPHTG